MAEKYPYSISGDFPNTAVDSTKLKEEIEDSAIATALSYINTSGDVCDVWFDAALSGGDETTLDGLVAAHDGIPVVYPDEAYASSEGESTVTIVGWTEKASLSFLAQDGDYMISWSAEAKTLNKNKVVVQVEQDDTDVLADFSLIPDMVNFSAWAPISGFKKVTLTKGTHTFDLDFATSVDTYSASLRYVRLRAKRLP